MATHDYVIDNQTAPNFRADLNNALLAIVSNNSSATAPAVTYANMMWYDTATNILYMRNEDNDAWIALGTLDQTADTFAAAVALASQAEAEAGTDNTKVMTPLRLRNALNATGTAPTYACRAWVNFNGTGTVAIRASGNVSSITDLGTGNYRVNFATSMPDSDYVALANVSGTIITAPSQSLATGSVVIRTVSSQDANSFDQDVVQVAIFR